MKKNLLNELNEMKYLFGYRRGKILSEQNTPFMEEEFEDDVMLMEPDVMEPDVKPKTRPRDPEEKPFDPDRDRRERNPDRLPYTDPDTHPQGGFDDEVEYEVEIDDKMFEPEYEIEFNDVDVAPTRERERTREREKTRETEKPFNPDRTRRERDPNRLPYTDPDTHPQGKDKDFDGDSALEKLVMKYLRSKK